ncbi:hypothetical protein ABH916_003072 [Peribacillus frigoritolerans]
MACTNTDVDFHYRHSLSAGGRGASSAFACGVSPRRAFPAGVSYLPFQSTLSYLLDRTLLPRVIFVLNIEVLKPEVMRMLSKHDSIQRDQLEMITLDQLVPPNHLVRKLEATIDFPFL